MIQNQLFSYVRVEIHQIFCQFFIDFIQPWPGVDQPLNICENLYYFILRFDTFLLLLFILLQVLTYLPTPRPRTALLMCLEKYSAIGIIAIGNLGVNLL